MAVTLQEISGWLDNIGLKHDIKEDDSKIITAMNQDRFMGITIEVEEDGELLQIYSNLLIGEENKSLKVKEHEHSGLVLQHMLKINYDTKFGTWEFDPKDGEIRFAVEIPLEDAKMTEKQFKRIISVIAQSEDGFAELLKIMETGECPEDKTMDDMLTMMLMGMLKEKLGDDADLDDLMKKLKGSGNSASDTDDGI